MSENLADLFRAPLFKSPDMTNQLNTPLTPVGQSLYQQYYGGDPNTRDYDLQGYFAQQGGAPPLGHGLDTFKKPSHPTFSTGSMYAGGDNQAGNWVQMPNGQWTFTPGATNMATFGLDNLRKYMADQEGANYLVEPPAQ